MIDLAPLAGFILALLFLTIGLWAASSFYHWLHKDD